MSIQQPSNDKQCHSRSPCTTTQLEATEAKEPLKAVEARREQGQNKEIDYVRRQLEGLSINDKRVLETNKIPSEQQPSNTSLVTIIKNGDESMHRKGRRLDISMTERHLIEETQTSLLELIRAIDKMAINEDIGSQKKENSPINNDTISLLNDNLSNLNLEDDALPRRLDDDYTIPQHPKTLPHPIVIENYRIEGDSSANRRKSIECLYQNLEEKRQLDKLSMTSKNRVKVKSKSGIHIGTLNILDGRGSRL